MWCILRFVLSHILREEPLASSFVALPSAARLWVYGCGASADRDVCREMTPHEVWWLFHGRMIQYGRS
ncbi:uncharacterized protein PHALS_07439 [Plasmopara halstedii]|uniref:Uncharacterized protein n=1 Tax=Plasmopara halstedii TaxID=4781 RepID=A0A0P1B6G3_PLAHL|nr:uncharacterized protein PHALS_07439 [Plasmopara halstedii]CEG49687.1 hypothetical protein PHALS_07439 [Plasmopara halstedii]|eukprot:XP_024586056.1 hypothetical protein PHALS_07439 [Plasmopara halstedii]